MTRARQQTARLDSRLEKPTTDRSFVWRGRVSLPLHLSGEGETGRKNEVANGQENHPVGPHRQIGRASCRERVQRSGVQARVVKREVQGEGRADVITGPSVGAR